MNFRIRALWLWLLPALAGVTPAVAVTVPDLYETAIPVTTTRDAAFVDALKSVLVRVSGRQDAPARLGSSPGNPRQYVQRFGFTADNVLQVGFDSVSVDRLLTDAGLPVWGRERPATLVLLNPPNGASAAERDAIARAARLRGLPLVWPDGGVGEITAGDSSSLLQTAARYNANAVLLGVARGDGVSTQWTLAAADANADTSGSLEDGVNLAADTFSRLYAASGSSLNSLSIEVSGIGTLRDYAGALNYMEGMTLVKSVAVEQVTGDTMKFRLAVRGDAGTLKRALALDGKLVPAGSIDTGAPDRLQFRFQP